MEIKMGQEAPLFNLFDTEKKKVSLSEYKGKTVLLLFFPQAFTSVCTEELCSIRDDIGKYSNANSDVIAISVDSVFTLKKYKEDKQYNFVLLSDFNKEVSDLYGVLYENWILEMKGVSKRAVFIIDKDGIIRFMKVFESANEIPDFKIINNVLDNLALNYNI